MTTAIKPASEMAAEIQGRDIEEESTDPKSQREYTFEFEHQPSHGKVLRGTFTNRILNIHQQLQVAALRARLCGNVPIDALDQVSWLTAERVAHMAISLGPKRPKWAEELTDLDDRGVISALYQEVAAHEAFFHGRGPDQEASPQPAKNAGGADAASPRGEE